MSYTEREEYKKHFNPCLLDTLSDSKIVLGSEGFNTYELDDYVRYRCVEFLAEEIKRQKVAGELAEFGVFKRDFARFINTVMPDRKLYLFDSFESFEKSEFNATGIDKTFYDEFTNTSPELVLQRMKNPQQCIVRKGFFPKSLRLEDYDLTFAFVSLDADLHDSMLEGLRFFYPRLNSGGYLMLHDYKTMWGHVSSAVADYESETGVRMGIVPIPDYCGSAVITKA